MFVNFRTITQLYLRLNIIILSSVNMCSQIHRMQNNPYCRRNSSDNLLSGAVSVNYYSESGEPTQLPGVITNIRIRFHIRKSGIGEHKLLY